MLTIDHRGIHNAPSTLAFTTLEGGLASDLKWGPLSAPSTPTLCHLDLQIAALSPLALPSYQLAVEQLSEQLSALSFDSILGIALYKGGMPPFPLEEFASYLHLIASRLPDALPPFALFECAGDPQLFSKEIFPYIHLGFRSGPIGVVRLVEETLRPLFYEGRVAILLPLRERALSFPLLEQCMQELEKQGRAYRLIAEPYLVDEWDALDELICFPELISERGRRMVEGFKAAGGRVSYYPY